MSQPPEDPATAFQAHLTSLQALLVDYPPEGRWREHIRFLLAAVAVQQDVGASAAELADARQMIAESWRWITSLLNDGKAEPTDFGAQPQDMEAYFRACGAVESLFGLMNNALVRERAKNAPPPETPLGAHGTMLIAYVKRVMNDEAAIVAEGDRFKVDAIREQFGKLVDAFDKDIQKYRMDFFIAEEAQREAKKGKTGA